MSNHGLKYQPRHGKIDRIEIGVKSVILEQFSNHFDKYFEKKVVCQVNCMRVSSKF